MPAKRGARLMAIESARSVPRAADPGRLDIERIRADETMIAIRSATPVTTARAARSGRRRLARPVARWGECGSDGAQNRPCGQSRQGAC